MNWLNIETATLDSEEFVGSDPIARATWLCLFRYCAGQENGGIIKGCKDWADRKWQQLARVTKEEVQTPSSLWTWEGNDLRLWAYPTEKETEVQAKREAGRMGGKSKSEAKLKAARENGFSTHEAEHEAQHEAESEALHERKGKEGEGERNEKGMEVGGVTSPLALPGMEADEANKVKAEKPTATKQTDDEWIASLSASRAFQGIDVRKEFAKMQAWCSVNKRQPTRRRFINWLNRCERPMSASASLSPDLQRERDRLNRRSREEGAF